MTGENIHIELENTRTDEEEISRPVFVPPVIKHIEEKPKHNDFYINGLNIKDDSVKVFIGKYIPPKNLNSIEYAIEKNGRVTLWGKVFAVNQQGNFRKIYIYSITDGKNSINVKLLLDPGTTDFDKYDAIKPGTYFLVNGDCQMDKYERDYVIMPHDIVTFSVAPKKDKAEKKRIELHLHTKLSSMDAVVNPDEAVRYAHDMGHKAIAITDHGVVQGFPQAMLEAESIQKNDPDFKLIYGCEGYLVDNIVKVYDGKTAGNLRDIEFVVFDIETTGLNPNNEAITEIGAVKWKNGDVIEEFQTFVNPGKKYRPILWNLQALPTIW